MTARTKSQRNCVRKCKLKCTRRRKPTTTRRPKPRSTHYLKPVLLTGGGLLATAAVAKIFQRLAKAAPLPQKSLTPTNKTRWDALHRELNNYQHRFMQTGLHSFTDPLISANNISRARTNLRALRNRYPNVHDFALNNTIHGLDDLFLAHA